MRKLLERVRRNERGFTLIELLVVVAIIGILAALAIPKITGAIDNSREKKDLADLEVIEQALDRFYTDHEFYPPALQALVDPEHPTQYLKESFDFKNAHGKYYFYAVRLDAANDTDNFQEYVLGDPGKHPHATIGTTDWTDETTELPEGIDPADGAWFYGTPAGSNISAGDVVDGSSTPANTALTFDDPDGNTWTFTALTDVTSTGETSRPTRDDLRTE